MLKPLLFVFLTGLALCDIDLVKDEEETGHAAACAMFNGKACSQFDYKLESLCYRCRLSEEVPGLKMAAGDASDRPNVMGSGWKKKMEGMRADMANASRFMQEGIHNITRLREAYEKTRRESEAIHKNSSDAWAARHERNKKNMEDTKKNAETRLQKEASRKAMHSERKALVRFYQQSRNFTEYRIGFLKWQLKWNDTLVEMHPESKLVKPIEEITLELSKEESGYYDTAEDAETFNNRHGYVTNETIGLINKTILEIVTDLNSTETRTNIDRTVHAAFRDMEDHPRHKKFKKLNITRRMTLPQMRKAHDLLMNEATPHIFKALNKTRRIMYHQQVAYMRAQTKVKRRRLFFRKLTVRTDNMMNNKRHDERRSYMLFDGERARRRYLNTWSVKRALHPDSSAQMAWRTFRAKYDLINEERNETVGDLFEYGLKQLPKHYRKRWEKGLRKAHNSLNNKTMWKDLKRRVDTLPRHVNLAHSAQKHAQRTGDDHLFPVIMNRFISKDTRARMRVAVKRMFTGEAFRVPRYKPRFASGINPDEIASDVISFFNDTLFGCRPDLFAPDPVYCFPFIDPDTPPIPNVPDNFTVSDRVPVNCTTHLIAVHGSVGVFDGFFQRIGDLFAVVYNEVPGLNFLYTFSDDDPRKDRYFEIFICGIPELILGIFIVLVFAIIFPFIAQAITETEKILALKALDDRVTSLEQNMISHHTDILPEV